MNNQSINQSIINQTSILYIYKATVIVILIQQMQISSWTMAKCVAALLPGPSDSWFWQPIVPHAIWQGSEEISNQKWSTLQQRQPMPPMQLSS